MWAGSRPMHAAVEATRPSIVDVDVGHLGIPEQVIQNSIRLGALRHVRRDETVIGPVRTKGQESMSERRRDLVRASIPPTFRGVNEDGANTAVRGRTIEG